ncbi:MAG: molybdopterin-binding protein [Anaerolineae bacterium]
MQLEQRAIADAVDTILVHNVADTEGQRILKKGTFLTEEHIAQLAQLHHETVTVAVLQTDDIHEDKAAATLASALQTEQLDRSRPLGGRVNLRSRVDGLLEVNADRLFALNLLPGITLATRPQHAVVGPTQDTANVGTLKIIPYAVRRDHLERALALARPRPGIVRVRPLHEGRRAALLLVGAPAVQDKLHDAFLPPIRTRLERLRASLIAVETVQQEESVVAQAASRLAEMTDLLIIAGQTSVMDKDDLILRALREAGAESTHFGAPVEPGNLLALAYVLDTPVLCAPGCARGMKRNAVDLVLPRLLLGDQLDRSDIAALGLGGYLA